MNTDPSSTAPTEQTPAARDLETMAGGREMVATMQDGARETVFIRKIGWREHDALLQCMMSLESAILITTGQSEEWLDRLSEDSYFELAEAAQELNRPTAERLVKAMAPAAQIGSSLTKAKA